MLVPDQGIRRSGKQIMEVVRRQGPQRNIFAREDGLQVKHFRVSIEDSYSTVRNIGNARIPEEGHAGALADVVEVRPQLFQALAFEQLLACVAGAVVKLDDVTFRNCLNSPKYSLW